MVTVRTVSGTNSVTVGYTGLTPTMAAAMVELDPETGFRYVRLGSGKVARTICADPDGLDLMIDLDEDGRVIGFESMRPFAGEPDG